jgi:hypothetical protein
MSLRQILYSTGAAIGIAALAGAMLAATPAHVSAQSAPSIGPADLGGVVRGPGVPEAGVWVIADRTSGGRVT